MSVSFVEHRALTVCRCIYFQFESAVVTHSRWTGESVIHIQLEATLYSHRCGMRGVIVFPLFFPYR
jgi:hypothetical protein